MPPPEHKNTTLPAPNLPHRSPTAAVPSTTLQICLPMRLHSPRGRKTRRVGGEGEREKHRDADRHLSVSPFFHRAGSSLKHVAWGSQQRRKGLGLAWAGSGSLDQTQYPGEGPGPRPALQRRRQRAAAPTQIVTLRPGPRGGLPRTHSLPTLGEESSASGSFALKPEMI